MYKYKKGALTDIKNKLIKHHACTTKLRNTHIEKIYRYLQNFKQWPNFKPLVRYIIGKEELRKYEGNPTRKAMCEQKKETSELVLSSGFNFQKAIDLPEKIFYRTFKIFTPDSSSCSSPKSKGSCIFDNHGLDYKPADREHPCTAWGRKNMTSSGNFYSNE